MPALAPERPGLPRSDSPERERSERGRSLPASGRGNRHPAGLPRGSDGGRVGGALGKVNHSVGDGGGGTRERGGGVGHAAGLEGGNGVAQRRGPILRRWKLCGRNSGRGRCGRSGLVAGLVGAAAGAAIRREGGCRRSHHGGARDGGGSVRGRSHGCLRAAGHFPRRSRRSGRDRIGFVEIAIGFVEEPAHSLVGFPPGTGDGCCASADPVQTMSKSRAAVVFMTAGGSSVGGRFTFPAPRLGAAESWPPWATDW
jgi:hypothetical protein